MNKQDHSDCRVMIVVDEPANVLLLECLLRRWKITRVCSTTDPAQAKIMFRKLQPDIVLLDLPIPRMDASAVMEQLRPLISPGSFTRILVLTADLTPDAKSRASDTGVTEFLAQPFDVNEAVERIGSLLDARLQHNAMRQHYQALEETVVENTVALRGSRFEMTRRRGLVSEYRDDHTRQHTQRVSTTCSLICEALNIKGEMADHIRLAAPLHDIGKNGVPNAILLKPGKLTRDERAAMQSHTEIGSRILGGSGRKLLQCGEEIARTHHERYDGSGYGAGLKGDRIPISGQIVAIADVYDALTHDRPYKKAWTKSAAVAEIRRNSGTQFAPPVVTAFEEVAEAL